LPIGESRNIIKGGFAAGGLSGAGFVMSASVIGRTAQRARSARRDAVRIIRERVDELVTPRCAGCAGEVRSGAVRARGSVFCSIECALAAAVPGVYLG